MKNIKSLISHYSAFLPIEEVRIFLQEILNVKLEQLLLKSEDIISEEDIARLQEYCTRRIAGEPVAYIIGKKEFFGLEFKVNSDVLIPRPDTELIVEESLKILHPSAKILDLCSGSGAVGIALAKMAEQSIITFADISEKAMEIAKLNAKFHKIENRANFILSNWFDGISENFDLITCNPPYISRLEINIMAIETIKYEPDLALFSDREGYGSYYILAQNAHKYLLDSGKMVIECGYNQASKISQIFRENNWAEIKIKKDITGIDRCLVLSYN